MPSILDPFPGLVISYSYLWRSEYQAGREEGTNDRPCAVMLSKKAQDGNTLVTVAAITHTRPINTSMSVEIPPKVKKYLGLDEIPSWIICTEVNRFIWPGPDIRAISNKKDNLYSYGVLLPKLFGKISQTNVRSLVKAVSRI